MEHSEVKEAITGLTDAVDEFRASYDAKIEALAKDVNG